MCLTPLTLDGIDRRCVNAYTAGANTTDEISANDANLHADDHFMIRPQTDRQFFFLASCSDVLLFDPLTVIQVAV